MINKGSIFQKTYDDSLERIRDLSLNTISHKLGAKNEENQCKIKLFNNEYTVSTAGITDVSDQQPSYDICVILSKYILLCPETPPKDHEWVSYRNFKNSAPLVGYFKKEVEEAISSLFSGKLNTLQQASESLAGYKPSLKVNYDFVVQLDALPKIPLILLYNDSDEEFPSTCSIMFESQAEEYLDCECLAMLGYQLLSHFKMALKE